VFSCQEADASNAEHVHPLQLGAVPGHAVSTMNETSAPLFAVDRSPAGSRAVGICASCCANRVGSRRMNHVLSGTALAVAFAIVVPAWAQSPTSLSSGSPSTSGSVPYVQPAPSLPQTTPSIPQQSATPSPQPAPYAQRAPAPSAGATTAPTDEATQSTPSGHAKRGHRAGRPAGQVARAGRRGGQPSDNVADQLNREEAGRVSSGSSTAPVGSSSVQAPVSPSSGGQMR
jgi:hypothetical protein